MKYSIAFVTVFLSSVTAVPVPGESKSQSTSQDVEVAEAFEAMNHPELYGGDIVDAEINNEVAGRPWPNGVVPYVIDSSLSKYRERILKAFEEFQKVTCIKFRPKASNDRAYIQLQHGSGCNSELGTKGRMQRINLQAPGCLYHGTIIHELGHAIGFHHTHQRSDRDDYIKINWNNVDENMKSAFNKGTGGEKTVPYDTASIMHYYSYAFSKNNEATITTKNGNLIEFANVLSPNDILAIKKLYKC